MIKIRNKIFYELYIPILSKKSDVLSSIGAKEIHNTAFTHDNNENIDKTTQRKGYTLYSSNNGWDVI